MSVKSSKSFRLSEYTYKIHYKEKSWLLQAQSDDFEVEFDSVRQFVCHKANKKWYNECWIESTSPDKFKQRITKEIKSSSADDEKIISIYIKVKSQLLRFYT